MIDLAQPDLKCKFNPMGICCDGHTLCSYCGWNPKEAERRKLQLRAKAALGDDLKCIVKRKYVIEDWTGTDDPR